MNKKPKPEMFEPYDLDMPSWIVDESLDRTTPYTEEELDLLVEGTLEGIRDTASWRNLVDRAGEEEAGVGRKAIASGWDRGHSWLEEITL
jgi:hypothetical protein